MPKRKNNPLDVSRELRQRAVLLWQKLDAGRGAVEGVDVLQNEKKRTVYRLRGGGPAGSDLIAKRCRYNSALQERTLYEEVLPCLRFPVVQLYGFAVEEDGRYAWLFIEDAGGDAYSPDREDHHVLAGTWLGLLHTQSADLAPPAGLRDPGPAHFKPFLQVTRDTIEETRSNPRLDAGDLAVLETIDAHCQVVARHWDELEEFCDQMPRTLVHGDFKEANMRLRPGPTGSILLVFDWEGGGWGVQALDLAKFLGYTVNPDMRAYCAIVQDRWPQMDIPTVQRLGYVGEVFRCIASIRWEVDVLRYEWVERSMVTLRIYAGWLNDIIQAEPWAEYARGGPAARAIKPRSWY